MSLLFVAIDARYLWLLMPIILVAIDAYSISGYFIDAYSISGYSIDAYSIGAY
jgi:hypothetical protein